MVDWFEKFFQSIFEGIDPDTVGHWVRGLFALIIGGLLGACVEMTIQIGAWVVQPEGTPFVIDRKFMIHAIVIAAGPSLATYFKAAQKAVIAEVPEVKNEPDK